MEEEELAKLGTWKAPKDDKIIHSEKYSLK
jgi:hypothetical protein